LGKNAWNQNVRRMFPKAWHLLEKRIREHPNEAREVGDVGRPPIHYATMFFGFRVISEDEYYSASLPDTTSHRTTSRWTSRPNFKWMYSTTFCIRSSVHRLLSCSPIQWQCPGNNNSNQYWIDSLALERRTMF
jgi:hypothetical protein